MTPEEPNRDQLFVAIHGDTAFIHVQGRASYRVGTALKRFGQAAIEANCNDFVLDMCACRGMDSTFMGVLAGLAFRLKRDGLGAVRMVNLGAQNRELLATIGLDRVFETFPEDAVPQEYLDVLGECGVGEALPRGAESVRTTAETMLEAHEQLVEASPENRPRFMDVITYLREDLERGDLDEEQPRE